MLLATGAAARAAIRRRLCLPAAGLPSVAFASIDPSCTRQFAAAARGGSAGGKEAGADKYAQAHESMGAFKSPIVKALWDRRGASKRQDLTFPLQASCKENDATEGTTLLPSGNMLVSEDMTFQNKPMHASYHCSPACMLTNHRTTTHPQGHNNTATANQP